MAKHFRRGRPTRFTTATGVGALTSTVLQIIALARFPAVFPRTAALFYGAGFALFWSAVRVTRGKLWACGQGGVSSSLVREGPYRFVRHPFYVAYDLVWLAGYVATLWWPTAVLAAVMATIYELAAREEEQAFLAGPLASEYRAYRRKAGRYWPRMFPVRR